MKKAEKMVYDAKDVVKRALREGAEVESMCWSVGSVGWKLGDDGDQDGLGLEEGELLVYYKYDDNVCIGLICSWLCVHGLE